MPDMKPFYSSHVSAAGYDPASGELHVDWQNGTRTVYEGIPYELASEILSSPSIGQALHLGVRGKFKHTTTKPE